MDKLKKILAFFVLINIQLISAQQTIILDETVFLHTNASTFVTGETLFYKIHCLKASDKTASAISKIGYVELVDNNQKSVFKTKIKLENSLGQGEYFIPTTLKTGTYKLIGYTNWMLNKPIAEMFQMNITIINPFVVNQVSTLKPENGTVVASSKEKIDNMEVYANENLKFKLDKKVFSDRELVNLSLQTNNKDFSEGNYSLSVRKIDDLAFEKTIKAVDFLPKGTVTVIELANNQKKMILPELRGEILSGKVTANNNVDKVENIAIAFSLPGKPDDLQISQTDSNGNFIFSFDTHNYNSNVILQIIDERAENYTVCINKSPEIDYSKLTFETTSNLSHTHKESLLDRSVSSQIENAYYYKKTDSLVKPIYGLPFYGSTKEYVLDNFTRFKTINETITEVATEIHSRKTNNDFSLYVMDNTTPNQSFDAALIFVDGLFIQHHHDLLDYNMKNIYKIELVLGKFHVGLKSFNGIISFTSFQNNFESKQTGDSILKTTFLRPQPKKSYHKINYSNPAENEKIPDFRNQLFWNPEVKLNSDSNNAFYTSDLSGLFEIRLEGFTKNGLPVSLKEIIEVKNADTN